MHAGAYRIGSLSLSDFARCCAMALLMTAAGLKLEGIFPRQSDAFRLAELSIVAWEVLLALWLVSGVFSRAAHRATIATFGLFAMVSLAMALERHASCECFGDIQVNPWITFVMDSCIVLMLLGSSSEVKGLSRRLLLSGVTSLIVACSIVVAIVAYRDFARPAGQVVRPGTAVGK